MDRAFVIRHSFIPVQFMRYSKVVEFCSAHLPLKIQRPLRDAGVAAAICASQVACSNIIAFDADMQEFGLASDSYPLGVRCASVEGGGGPNEYVCLIVGVEAEFPRQLVIMSVASSPLYLAHAAIMDSEGREGCLSNLRGSSWKFIDVYLDRPMPEVLTLYPGTMDWTETCSGYMVNPTDIERGEHLTFAMETALVPASGRLRRRRGVLNACEAEGTKCLRLVWIDAKAMERWNYWWIRIVSALE